MAMVSAAINAAPARTKGISFLAVSMRGLRALTKERKRAIDDAIGIFAQGEEGGQADKPLRYIVSGGQREGRAAKAAAGFCAVGGDIVGGGGGVVSLSLFD